MKLAKSLYKAFSLTFMKRIIDLTHDIENGMLFYPKDPKPRIRSFRTIDKDGVNISEVRIGSHTGTHIDAPFHFIKKGKKVDEIDLESLIGNGTVIDLSFLKPGSEIMPMHFKDKVKTDIVLFYTGLSKEWRKKFRKEYTYIGTEAAKTLVSLSVKLVGIDYLSVEKFGVIEAPVHKILLSNNITIVESLNSRLSELIGKDFTFFCVPLKLKGCDGAPARAFAYEM